MKSFFVLVVCIAVAVALPLDDPKSATVVKYDSDNIGIGPYRYSLQTSDGKSVQEQGELLNVGTDDEGISVKGSFSYVDPNGQTITVNYIADNNGFQPQGDHIPRA